MAGIGNEIWQAARRLLRDPGVHARRRADARARHRGQRDHLRGRAARGVESAAVSRVRPVGPARVTACARINVLSGIGMTSGLYYQYQRARTLEGLAIYRAGESTLVGRGEPERIQVARTTPTLASVLRVPPALGRWFTEEEGTPGAPLVTILSHGLWMRRFGGDAASARHIHHARRRARDGHRHHAGVVRVSRAAYGRVAPRCRSRAQPASAFPSATSVWDGCAPGRRSPMRAPS